MVLNDFQRAIRSFLAVGFRKAPGTCRGGRMTTVRMGVMPVAVLALVASLAYAPQGWAQAKGNSVQVQAGNGIHAGEFAVRGSIVDLFPAGEEQAIRLDFFGDEVETMRRFDPADQRSTGKAEAFTLMPASEALLDEESIKRFRARYREQFGANATGDPLYQAISGTGR